MKKGKAGFENKGLVAVLVVLLIFAVGLAAGIIVNNIVRDDINSLIEKEWSGNTACFEDGTVYDISVCVNEIYASGRIGEDVNRNDLVIGLYNKAIDEALVVRNYDRTRELLISRSSFFVLHDDCSVAMALLNDGRSDELEGYNEGVFYSYALSLGASCEDEESITLWESALTEYNKGVKDGFGF